MRQRIVALIILFGITFLTSSCYIFDSSNDLTIVKGKVTDNLTGDNIEGIPVELQKCSSGLNFQGPMCDSVKAAYTNSEGEYDFSFTTEKRYYYKVRIARNANYSSTETSYDGSTVNEGSTNEIDFKVTPYRVVEIKLTADKRGKNFLKIDYNAWGCNVGWYGGTLLLDTSRANQLVKDVRYLKVFPGCDYRFQINLCNRSGVMIQDYVYKDCNDINADSKIFYVNNVDTTKIGLTW